MESATDRLAEAIRADGLMLAVCGDPERFEQAAARFERATDYPGDGTEEALWLRLLAVLNRAGVKTYYVAMTAGEDERECAAALTADIQAATNEFCDYLRVRYLHRGRQ